MSLKLQAVYYFAIFLKERIESLFVSVANLRREPHLFTLVIRQLKIFKHVTAMTLLSFLLTTSLVKRKLFPLMSPHHLLCRTLVVSDFNLFGRFIHSK